MTVPVRCFGLAFGLESGTDFTAGVSGVVFVHNVAERGKIIVPSGTVHAVIDGDKANATLTQDFHNLTDFQIVTTHLSIILNEASRRAGAGGPFWIIG